MSETKFKVGDRVGLSYSENEDYQKTTLKYCEYQDDLEIGEVVKINSDNSIQVKWDADHMNRSHKGSFLSKDLLLETDITQKFSEFEKQFSLVQAEIKIKCQEAAKLINEAGVLAESSGRDLSEMYEAYNIIYRAMDNCGWNSSGFGC